MGKKKSRTSERFQAKPGGKSRPQGAENMAVAAGWRRFAPYVLLGLALIACALANTGPVATNDIGFHLRIGQEIAETGRPPRADFHSHTCPGAPYPDHEWLAQLALYELYRLFGDARLAALQGLLIGIALALVAASARGPLALKLALVLAVMLLGFNHAEIRPHLFFWVMAGLLNIFFEHRLKPAVIVLLVLWANTHGSVLLGVGIAGLSFLEEYWSTRRKSCLLWAGGCALAPLLNFYGLNIYTIFFQIKSHADFVGEWKAYSPDTFEFWLLVALAAFALIGLLKARPLNPFDFIRVGVLGFLAFQSSRNGVVAAIFLAPLFGRWYGPFLSRRSTRLRYAAAGFLLALCFLILGQRAKEGKALQFRIDYEHLPVEAVRFIKAHGLKGPIFNDYNFGGTLLWKAWPDCPVFVDGRIEVYKDRILDEYLSVSRAEPGWENVISRYAIAFFLVRPEREIAKVLLKSADWDLAYFDYHSVVFVRRDLFPGLKRLEVISPYGNRDPAKSGKAIEEITYVLKENPLFFGGHKILAFLLYRRGDYQGAARSLRRYLELHPEGIKVEETRSLIEGLKRHGVAELTD